MFNGSAELTTDHIDQKRYDANVNGSAGGGLERGIVTEVYKKALLQQWL
ncbi:hypothetical protein [uncultured Bartonella sp.]|nr:hypothetical protein [uncultured Bartonella sp.]